MWKQSKTKQGNLKTVKLTEKQSYGTSHCILKTAKKVVMGKLKTRKMFEKVKHQLCVFETHVLHCCRTTYFRVVFQFAGSSEIGCRNDRDLSIQFLASWIPGRYSRRPFFYIHLQISKEQWFYSGII